MTLTEDLEQLRYAADCPVSGTPEDNMALWAKLEEAYRAGRLVEARTEEQDIARPLLEQIRSEWYTFTGYSQLKADIDYYLDEREPQRSPE